MTSRRQEAPKVISSFNANVIFIYLFDKYIVSTNYIQGNILDIGESAMNKIEKKNSIPLRYIGRKINKNLTSKIYVKWCCVICVKGFVTKEHNSRKVNT